MIIANLNKSEIYSIVINSLKNNKEDWCIGNYRSINKKIGVSIWKCNGLHFFELEEIKLIHYNSKELTNHNFYYLIHTNQGPIKFNFFKKLSLYLTYTFYLSPKKSVYILPNVIFEILIFIPLFISGIIIKFTERNSNGNGNNKPNTYKLLMEKHIYRENRLNKIKNKSNKRWI